MLIESIKVNSHSATCPKRRDFIYIKEDVPENVPDLLRQIFTKELYKHQIHPRDAMVLVPMNRGSVGTQKLNYDLQTYFESSNL